MRTHPCFRNPDCTVTTVDVDLEPAMKKGVEAFNLLNPTAEPTVLAAAYAVAEVSSAACSARSSPSTDAYLDVLLAAKDAAFACLAAARQLER